MWRDRGAVKAVAPGHAETESCRSHKCGQEVAIRGRQARAGLAAAFRVSEALRSRSSVIGPQEHLREMSLGVIQGSAWPPLLNSEYCKASQRGSAVPEGLVRQKIS